MPLADHDHDAASDSGVTSTVTRDVTVPRTQAHCHGPRLSLVSPSQSHVKFNTVATEY